MVLVDVWQPPAHLFLPCTENPEAWHPDPVSSVTKDEAAAMCAGCEVQADCYLAGVAQHETGIWGGARLIAGRPPRRNQLTQPAQPDKDTHSEH